MLNRVYNKLKIESDTEIKPLKIFIDEVDEKIESQIIDYFENFKRMMSINSIKDAKENM